MNNLLKSEIYKLKHSKELKANIILLVLLGIISIVFKSATTGREGFFSEFREMSSLIICAIFAGMFIGNEFSKRTIFHTITSGYSRFSILISKFLSYLMGCFFILVFNFFIYGVIYSLIYGWGTKIDIRELIFIIIYFIIDIIFDLCVVSIIFLIPIILRDNALSTAVSAFFMAIILAITQVSWSYYILDISNGFSSTNVINLLVVFFSMVMIPIIVIFAGHLLFKNHDIK